MDYSQIDPMVRLSRRLFPLRRWLYGVPVLILLLNAGRLYYPFGEHFYDEMVEFTGAGLALLGGAVRLWASGTTRRAVTRKQKQVFFHLCRSGVYSLVRHPYFIADLLIVAGLSLPLIDPVLILLSLSIFLLFYLPQVFAYETVLLHQSPEAYRDYCRKTRLMIPSFKPWKKNRFKFRWDVALRKEGNVLTSLGILFFLIEKLRELVIQNRWELDPLWLTFVVPFLLLFILMRVFDRSMEDLRDYPSWLDYD